MDLDQKFEAYLSSISYRGIKPGLERVEAALNRFGNPQDRLKIFHIAGTNGKGSTTSILSQLLAISGQSVGLTLSPHIHSVRERMQSYQGHESDAKEVSSEALWNLHIRVQEKCADIDLTYFEYLIVLAVLHFVEMQVDSVVLETGLGGR